MGTIAQKTGTDFKPAPAGNHLAVCVGVYDVGIQKKTFQGTVSWKPCVTLQFELCDELMEDGRPFSLSQTFTLSLHENSALRPFLQTWRNRPFTEAELAGFDIKNVLGVPCFLAVSHQVARDGSGKVFAQVDSAAPLPKRMQVPEPTIPLRYYSFEDGPPPADLPKGVLKKIAASQQMTGTAVSDIPPASKPGEAGFPDGDGEDDEIPF